MTFLFLDKEPSLCKSKKVSEVHKKSKKLFIHTTMFL